MKREQSNHQSDLGYDEWDDFGGEEDKENSYPHLAYEHSVGEFSPKKVIVLKVLIRNIQDAFIVYTIENIEKRINEKVSELKDVLGMNADQAIAVLRYFKWNMDKIQNEWFVDDNRLRKKIGIDYD